MDFMLFFPFFFVCVHVGYWFSSKWSVCHTNANTYYTASSYAMGYAGKLGNSLQLAHGTRALALALAPDVFEFVRLYVHCKW